MVQHTEDMDVCGIRREFRNCAKAKMPKIDGDKDVLTRQANWVKVPAPVEATKFSQLPDDAVYVGSCPRGNHVAAKEGVGFWQRMFSHVDSRDHLPLFEIPNNPPSNE